MQGLDPLHGDFELPALASDLLEKPRFWMASTECAAKV